METRFPRIPRKPRQRISLIQRFFKHLRTAIGLHWETRVLAVTLGSAGSNANDLQDRTALQQGACHRVACLWTSGYRMFEHAQGTDRNGRRQDRTRPLRGDACWSRRSHISCSLRAQGYRTQKLPPFSSRMDRQRDDMTTIRNYSVPRLVLLISGSEGP